MAAETGISKSSVARYFQLFGLQLHRTESFKRSTDPFFIEKLRDVVGLYLSPPDNALGICVEEKSQCQALERTQPMLPMRFGYVEGVTHDYKRHGTTKLFAALNVLNGSVLPTCKPRHWHQEFLAFLRKVDKAVRTLTASATTTPPTAIPRSKLDWPRWPMHFISTKVLGSIRSSASSHCSPTRPFGAVRSPASNNSCNASTTSSPLTTRTANRSDGPPLLIPPLKAVSTLFTYLRDRTLARSGPVQAGASSQGSGR